MTKSEFLNGWDLLLLQRWGKPYNQFRPDGTPTGESLKQLNFYFTQLQWAHPEAWVKVATLYARGREWPSVEQLDDSLRATNSRFIKALKDQREKTYCECPPEAAVTLDRLRDPNRFSFVDNKETVG